MQFHPYRKGSRGPAIPVARVVCDGPRATVEVLDVHARDIDPFDPAGLAQKLQFLVENAGPRPFEELTMLRSDFWSFVPAEAALRRELG